MENSLVTGHRHSLSRSALHKVKHGHSMGSELAHRLWQFLGKIEPTLKQAPAQSVGQSSGERIDLQWWTDESGQFFAIQAMDKQHLHQWELLHVPVPGGISVAGRRSIWIGSESNTGSDLLDEAWDNIFVPAIGDSHECARHPSFLDVLVAGLTPNGCISVRDESAAIENLRADVDYWSQLAKSLHKNGKSGSNEHVHRHVVTNKAKQEDPHETPVRKWKLSEIECWATENSHRIIILPRAISAAKRSNYEQEEFVFECLELLANEYTQTKRGLADRYTFKNKADAMGLAYGGSVDPSVAGTRAEEYFVRWGGRRRFLDQHITKGNSRDPRFSMRIYFTWDEASETVVVGWLPSHLGTSST